MNQDDLALKSLFYEASSFEGTASDEAFVAGVMREVQADIARKQIWREAARITLAVIFFSLIAFLAPSGLQEIETAVLASAAIYGLSQQAVMLTLLLSLSFGGWWLATRN
jgi:ABC-type methionine transport system permease subunit